MPKLCKITAAACAAFLVTCSPINSGLSGTSEQGNARIIASVFKSDGTPASGATVRLLPQDYVHLPGMSASALRTGIVDMQGSFTIDSLDTGAYSIEVNDTAKQSVLLRCSIGSPQEMKNIPADTLRPWATVKGTIDTAGIAGARLFVQVPGLERLVQVDPSGSYTLNDLPAGQFTIRIVNIDASQTTVVRTDQVVAQAGSTTIVTMQGWSYSQNLYFNTTASGADIALPVMDFPVLIRLTDANFTFSQAAADGRDIRFAKPDNTPLTYEIERWDGAAQSAEVWVRIDTIHGNNQSQHILMFWGNPDVATLSNGSSVFDTAAGFQGVWHFSESGEAPAFDATANRYNGTPYHLNASAAKPGTIGLSRWFSGDSSCFIMEGTADSKLNFPENWYFTLSAWVYSDTVDQNMIHTIAAKGDCQYNLILWPFDQDRWLFSEWVQTGRDAVDIPYTGKTWLHIVGVRSGAGEFLYVNGTLVDSSSLVWPPPDSRFIRYTGFDFMVGRIASNARPNDRFFFRGNIDELRACDAARSADWVKLSYMNQRIDDKLVEMR